MIVSLLSYGLGPFGVGMSQNSGLVLTEWLTLEEVVVREPNNFWFGPSAHHLVRLGAKLSACMRRDELIAAKISTQAAEEAGETGCCVRNDRSGCFSTSEYQCSPFLSTFHKWGYSNRG